MTEHPYIVFIRRRQVGENSRQMKPSPVSYFVKSDQYIAGHPIIAGGRQ